MKAPNLAMDQQIAEQRFRAQLMIPTGRSFRRLAGMFGAGIIAITAFPAEPQPTGAITVYKPDPAIKSQMGAIEAENTFRDLLGRATYFVGGEIQEAKVSPEEYSYVQGGKTHRYRFLNYESPKVEDGTSVGYNYAVGVLAWKSEKEARSFADAMLAMNQYAFADFQKKAQVWRELPAKPALAEEVQRCRVLAEEALRNRNTKDAWFYYSRGVTEEPLWAEGHFNAALLAAELGKYEQAAAHMKCYLELKPEAKDARAAREKMWLWEDKEQKFEKDQRGGFPVGFGAGVPDLFAMAELDQQPVVRSQAFPVYPSELRNSGISGGVVVAFIVSTTGTVLEPTIVSSDRREFEAPAVQAVSKWKFKPGRKGGRVVNTKVLAPVGFAVGGD
ncbi:MAG TPA: TonB family protein [Opitutaceae bacterium]|nr:TonB family protein [Opitutaceae bacterium]